MVLFTYNLLKKAGNLMDANAIYTTFKEHNWISFAILFVPLVVKLLGMLTASKLEKHIFNPKQKIYTRTANLVLHSTAATLIAYVFFLVMGLMIKDPYFLAFIFLVYLFFFLIVLSIREMMYKPILYIEDNIHGKLYLQNVSSEGKLILYSEPNPNNKEGFYVIKENTSILLNTKIYSIRNDQFRLTKILFMLIDKLFKKKQNVSQ